MDWALFWAAMTAAATVATAISTSVVLVLRRRDRPEPDWAVLVHGTSAPNPDDRYGNAEPRAAVLGRLTNAGDGYAFRVTASGRHCEAMLTSDPSGNLGLTSTLGFLAVIEPGESVRLRVYCTPEDWDRAELLITWTRPPTRLKKRMTAAIPIQEIADLPEAT